MQRARSDESPRGLAVSTGVPRRVGRWLPQRRMRGFTLLEVMVAMALIGIGFSAVFLAMSGTTRLSSARVVHEAAATLARAKLDEVLIAPDYALSEEAQEDRFAGQLFGYRIKIKAADLPRPNRLAGAVMPFALEDIAIEVFWGPTGAQQSYSLATQRFAPKAALAASGAGS